MGISSLGKGSLPRPTGIIRDFWGLLRGYWGLLGQLMKEARPGYSMASFFLSWLLGCYNIILPLSLLYYH